MSDHSIKFVVLTSQLLEPRYETPRIIEKAGKLTIRSVPRGPARSANVLHGLTILSMISSCRSYTWVPKDIEIVTSMPENGSMELWCGQEIREGGQS